MLSLKINAPKIKEKTNSIRIIIPILSLISSIFIFAPVIVGFKSNFTTGDYSAAYLVFRGLFGISLIICSVIFSYSKSTFISGVASLFAFITSLFPFIGSISEFAQVRAFAQQYSMTADYSTYLESMAIYLAFTLLSLFTFLYSTGILPVSIVVLVLSVVSFLATIFISVQKVITFNISIFDTLCFGYCALTSVLPILLVASTEKNKSKKAKERYTARRMK